MRWIWRASVAIVVLAAAIVAGGYLWLRGSLPELDGTIRVAGPTQSIEIIRDRFGVPHVFAATRADSLFGLGFVHAQDRLWQMEISRRLGSGRLAEILGEAALRADLFIRNLDLYGHATRSYAALDLSSRALLDAYVAGVNAYLVNHDQPLPPEFLILRHHPEPWTPADSLVWVKLMALDLSGNWTRELLRLRLARRLSPKQIDDLFTPYRATEPRGLPEIASLYPDLPAEILDRTYAGAMMPLGEGAGSNNWVVSGRRSATGGPLLANDPHLAPQAPAIWYFAHLQWPGHNVIGATAPGLPLVVLGRNDRIAWGFTNTGPDVQDLYIERIDPADSSRYLTPDGSGPFELRQERIRVRDKADILRTFRRTRHGPVISDVHRLSEETVPEGYALSLAWTALSDDDLTAQAGLKVAVSGNWEAFVEAVRDFHSPQQSIVYADTDGNIGYYAPARVPVRHPKNKIKGFMPQPGWDATYDWNGFIPFQELPHSFNPEVAAIVTANHKVVPDDYPHQITLEWEDAYRAERILELLAGRKKHSLESFKMMQQDDISLMARELLPRLLAPEPDSETARRAHALLAAWNGEMERGRPEPLIFSAWYRELTRLIYADELGALFQHAWGKRARFIAKVLSGEAGVWCDDINTDGKETCDDLVRRGLELGLKWIRERYGEDMGKWRWGEVHTVRSRHRPFGDVTLLTSIFDIQIPSPGGTYTINAGHHNIANANAPFSNVHAPSLRAIYDLDEPDRSLYIHSTGQSGNPLSPLYRNFVERWSNAGYIPMTTRREEIEIGALGTLILEPQ